MQRTTRQMVFDLLDREGNLKSAEIAERLGITEGSAHGNKNRWKKTRGYYVGTRQNPVKGMLRIPAGEDGHVPKIPGALPSFRTVLKVPPAKVAPAEVESVTTVAIAERQVMWIQKGWGSSSQKTAIIRDGELKELSGIGREDVKADPDGCIEFIQAIKKAMAETNK